MFPERSSIRACVCPSVRDDDEDDEGRINFRLVLSSKTTRTRCYYYYVTSLFKLIVISLNSEVT